MRTRGDAWKEPSNQNIKREKDENGTDVREKGDKGTRTRGEADGKVQTANVVKKIST